MRLWIIGIGFCVAGVASADNPLREQFAREASQPVVRLTEARELRAYMNLRLGLLKGVAVDGSEPLQTRHPRLRRVERGSSPVIQAASRWAKAK
jgi:hypothetical protein